MKTTIPKALRWTDANRSLFFNKIHSRKLNFHTGASCLFFKINASAGVKLYATVQERDYAWKHQKRAVSHGIAPNIGERFHTYILSIGFEMEESYSIPLYGYITQVAHVRQNSDLDYGSSEVKQLCESLRHMGLSSADIHSHNVGYIDGTLVCIDFDQGSHY